jgi:hypothetical protein
MQPNRELGAGRARVISLEGFMKIVLIRGSKADFKGP